jgi:hypothetical protein
MLPGPGNRSTDIRLCATSYSDASCPIRTTKPEHTAPPGIEAMQLLVDVEVRQCVGDVRGRPNAVGLAIALGATTT